MRTNRVLAIAFLSLLSLGSYAQISVSVAYAMGRFNSGSLNKFRDSYNAYFTTSDPMSKPGFGSGMSFKAEYISDFVVLGLNSAFTKSESSSTFSGGGKQCLVSNQFRTCAHAGVTTGFDEKLISTAYFGFGIQSDNIKVFHQYADGVISYGSESPFNGIYDGSVNLCFMLGATGEIRLIEPLSVFAGFEYSLAALRMGTYFKEINYSKLMSTSNYYPIGIPTDVGSYYADPYTFITNSPEFVKDGLNGLIINFGVRFRFADM